MKATCFVECKTACIFLLLLNSILSLTSSGQQTSGLTSFDKATGLPGWHIEQWEEIVHDDHPTFAHWSAPLGDINGDGYDDIAIATATDTTFIFLGGDPFDHEPAYFLYGGGSGIDVGDFNGDGLLDLVTGRRCLPLEDSCFENRGEIRIYFQNDDTPAFDQNDAFLIVGNTDERVGALWTSRYSGVQALDYNNDGFDDLLTRMRDESDSVGAKAILFLGGRNMDKTIDLEFRMKPITEENDRYAHHLQVGDFNGDGCDDMLISGTTIVNGRLNFWDLFLGDPDILSNKPHRVLRSIGAWAPQFDVSCVIDINNDGYDDIVDGGKKCLRRVRGDVPVFLSGPILPDVILPNDSIPNYDPHPLGDQSPGTSDPVGDMNGDGIEDLIIGWNSYFYAGLPTYYFFEGGNNYHSPSGYTGASSVDYVRWGTFPAGDVNGDGYGDMLMLGMATNAPGTKYNRFQIHLGARQLSTSIENSNTAENFTLSIAPNPLSTKNRTARVLASGLAGGVVTVKVIDQLGRQLYTFSEFSSSDTRSYSIDCSKYLPGTYILLMHQNSELISRKFIIL